MEKRSVIVWSLWASMCLIGGIAGGLWMPQRSVSLSLYPLLMPGLYIGALSVIPILRRVLGEVRREIFLRLSVASSLFIIDIGFTSTILSEITSTPGMAILLGVLFCGMLAAAVGLVSWQYLQHPARWMTALIISGMAASGIAIAVYQHLAALGSTLANGAAGAIVGLGWAVVPGIILVRELEHIPPHIAEKVQQSLAKQARPRQRMINRIVLVVSVAIILILIIVTGLQTCQWLDRLVQRSGCQQQLAQGQEINGLAFIADNRLLASATWDNGFQISAANDGSIVHSFPITEPNDFARAVVFSPDGTLIGLASDRKVQLWSLEQNMLIQTFDFPVTHMTFSPDGRALALGRVSASEPSKILIWSTHDRQLLRTLPSDGSLSPDWQTIAVKRKGVVELRRLEDNALLQTLTHTPSSWLRAIVWSPDGSALATVGFEGAVEIWRASDGTLMQKLTHNSDLATAAWSPDGSLLAVGGGDFEYGALWFWRVNDGAQLHAVTMDGYDHDISSLVWSSDGSLLVSGSGDGIRYWKRPI